MMKTAMIFIILIFITNISFSENDSSIYVDIVLTPEEEAKVDSIVSLIFPDSIIEFKNKYEKWIESTNNPEIQMHSDPGAYKTTEYYEFKDFTLGLGAKYIGLLIDFFKDHNDGVPYYLLLEITFDDYGYLIDDIREELKVIQYTEDSIRIFYTHLSFAYCYFKKILSKIHIVNNDLIITSIILKGISHNPPNILLYPNPVNNFLTIEFELIKSTSVTVKLYNVSGQLIEVLKNNAFYEAGRYSLNWLRKEHLVPGNYLLIFETNDIELGQNIIFN